MSKRVRHTVDDANLSINQWLRGGQQPPSSAYSTMMHMLDTVIRRDAVTEPTFVYCNLDESLAKIRRRLETKRTIYVRRGYTSVGSDAWAVQSSIKDAVKRDRRLWLLRIKLLPGQHLYQYSEHGEALLPRDLQLTIIDLDAENRWVNAVATPRL